MCNLCMMWHSYPPTLPKYSKGGKNPHSVWVIYEWKIPWETMNETTMNEKSPGNLEQKEKMNVPRKILRFQ